MDFSVNCENPFWPNTTTHFPPALTYSHTDMSGSGRPRTSSFAEPPGAPGAAAAAAGSAVAGGSTSGKTGASQAAGGSSSAFGNLRLSSEYILLCQWDRDKC